MVLLQAYCGKFKRCRSVNVRNMVYKFQRHLQVVARLAVIGKYEERQLRIREQNEMQSRTRSESYDGKDLKPCLTPGGEEYATLRQRQPEAIPPCRNYMGRVGLWLSQVGWEQQSAGEAAYGYVSNNPCMLVDPYGNEPQGKNSQQTGSVVPQIKTSVGKGGSGNKCPGQDAYNLLLRTIRANKACMNAIQQVCPNGASKAISSIKFVTKQACIVNAPADPCATDVTTIGSGNSYKCTSSDICFNSKTCSDPVGERAGDLLFELINYCNCTFKNAPLNADFEKCAEHVIKVCKVRGDKGQGGGGIFK